MTMLARFVNFIIALSLSLIPLWIYVDWTTFDQFMNRFEPDIQRGLLPAAIFVLALNLYSLLSRIFRCCGKRRDIEITSADGSIVISVAAVERRLLDLTNKFNDVRQARVALHFKKKDAVLRCSLNFGLARDTDISGRVEEIKHCLRDAFTRLLPGAPGLEINAKITELRAEEGKSVNSSGDFYGPVYPSAADSVNGDEH